jgi:hypothetical protein
VQDGPISAPEYSALHSLISESSYRQFARCQFHH